MRDQLGSYRLLGPLGSGSFGSVYRAVRDGTETPVALKVLPMLEDVEREDLQRFWLEGQIATRLSLPGVVAGLELGEAGGRYYLAMEYVPGRTLKELLAGGPLELVDAVELIADLAETLSEVHAAGVIHRDLKPANIIVDERTGTPRIMDFGLAQDRSLLRSMTRTGDLIGTPVYMAPEQIQGLTDVDHRIDVYALGAIFYECVTGRRPHEATDFYELGRRILRVQPTPPSRLREGLSRRVDQVCACAMAKRPADRYADCGALASALRGLLTASGGRSLPRGTWAVIGAAVVVGAVAFGVAVAVSDTHPPPVVASSAPPAPSVAAPPPPSPAAAPSARAGSPSAADDELRRARALLARGDHQAAEAVLKRLPRLTGRARDEAKLLTCFVISFRRPGWSAYPSMLGRLARTAGRDTIVGGAAFALYSVSSANRWRARSERERREKLEDAELAARSVLRREPAYVPALIALASTLVRTGAREADEVWKRADAAAPNDALVVRAEAQSYRRVDEARAERARDRFLELTHGTRSYVRARYLRDRGWDRVLARRPGADADLQEVIETRPYDMRPHVGLGVVALRAGKPEVAARRLLLARALSPEPGRKREAEDYLKRLAPAEAKAAADLVRFPIVEHALKDIPAAHRAPLRAALEAAADRRSSHEQVARRLALAAAIRPDVPSAAWLRARIAAGRHLFQAAGAALAQCEALGVSPSAVGLLRADLEEVRGRRSAARRAYEALRRGGGPAASIARAELLLLDGSDAAALKAADALIQDHPRMARPHVLRARALLRRDPAQALMSAATARTIQGDLDVRAFVVQHQAHIGCLRANLRAWLPSSHYVTITQLAPSAWVRLELVGTLLDLMQREERPDLGGLAERLLIDARKLEPNHPRVDLYRGWLTVFEKQGTAEEVLTLWRAFRKRDGETAIPAPARRAFERRFPASTSELRRLRVDRR